MLPTLRIGDNAQLVSILQDGLSQLGYNIGTSDGVFGSLTQSAVTQFQTDNNVADDYGIVGPPTWTSLASHWPTPLAPLDLNRMPIDNTDQTITELATVITSEMSVGNQDEQVAVAYTLINRLRKSGGSDVTSVWGAYAHNQTPTQALKLLASNIQAGFFSPGADDNVEGATFFYSPQSMPKEGQENLCTFGGGIMDCNGGLEGPIPPLTARNYRPSWAVDGVHLNVTIDGVRDAWCKCYR